MNYIVITDIFGNKISKKHKHNIINLPFILLHTTQPHLLMNRIAKINSDTNSSNSNVTSSNTSSSAWELIYPSIMHILHINKINPSQFAAVGHMWYPKNKLPHNEEILLVNTNSKFSKYPTDFVNVGKYQGLNVWKPIGPRDFRGIGYLMGKRKPSVKLMRTVNEGLLTSFNDNNINTNEVSNMNEFKLVVAGGNKRYTINRTKLLKSDFMVRVYGKDGIITEDIPSNADSESSYSSVSEDSSYNSNRSNRSGLKLLLKKKKNQFQTINYTVQGELKMDDMCIGITGNDSLHDNYVYLQNCDGTNKQKWYPYASHLVSQHNGTCLKGNTEHVTSSDCTDDDSQLWTTESLRVVTHESNQENISNWRTRYGKNVVLMEPDDPWYIKKEPEGLMKQDHHELNKLDYSDNADFNSKFMIDANNSSVGKSYSYEQIKGNSCSCLDDCVKIHTRDPIFEGFDGEVENELQEKGGIDFNLMACILLTLVILIIVTRMMINWRNSTDSEILST
jgi:hypothetical protein